MFLKEAQGCIWFTTEISLKRNFTKYAHLQQEHFSSRPWVHYCCMTYTCGHRNVDSSYDHQTAAALTSDDINTHLACQVQQNAFILWQSSISLHRRANVLDCIKATPQSACPEYASGNRRACPLCLLCFQWVDHIPMPSDKQRTSHHRQVSSRVAHNGKRTC